MTNAWFQRASNCLPDQSNPASRQPWHAENFVSVTALTLTQGKPILGGPLQRTPKSFPLAQCAGGRRLQYNNVADSVFGVLGVRKQEYACLADLGFQGNSRSQLCIKPPVGRPYTPMPYGLPSLAYSLSLAGGTTVNPDEVSNVEHINRCIYDMPAPLVSV